MLLDEEVNFIHKVSRDTAWRIYAEKTYGTNEEELYFIGKARKELSELVIELAEAIKARKKAGEA